LPSHVAHAEIWTDVLQAAQDIRVVKSGKTGQTFGEGIVTALLALGLGVRCGEDKKKNNSNTEERSFHMAKTPEGQYIPVLGLSTDNFVNITGRRKCDHPEADGAGVRSAPIWPNEGTLAEMTARASGLVIRRWWRRRELNPRPRAVKSGYYMLVSPLVLVHVLPGERGMNVDQPLDFRRLRRDGSQTLSSP
jgi:hypothetical protein